MGLDLPLGTDRLGATRGFAHAQHRRLPAAALHHAPARAAGCRSATRPRATPWSASTSSTRATAPTSPWSPAPRVGGKTVAVNALLARNLARGAPGHDHRPLLLGGRGRDPRHAGHYEQLAALIPGAEKLHFGAGRHDAVLNPWDVPDPARVPARRRSEFLARAAHAADRRPTRPDERALSGRGTHAARARHQRRLRALRARPASAPRERLLYEELPAPRARAGRRQPRRRRSVASEVPAPRRAAAPLLRGRRPRLARRPGDHDPSRGAAAAVRPRRAAGRAGGAGDAHAGRLHRPRRAAPRRATPRHPRRAPGPWAGRAFVAIDESWKPLRSKAAGAWLNEWARRTRHMACALLAITQHLADFANAQGHALLSQSVLRVFFRTSRLSLAYIRDALGAPRRGPRGDRRRSRPARASTRPASTPRPTAAAQVRIYLSDMEYWTVSSDPERDQPIRQLALEQSGGDPWGALRLLVDPAWHREQARVDPQRRLRQQRKRSGAQHQ